MEEGVGDDEEEEAEEERAQQGRGWMEGAGDYEDSRSDERVRTRSKERERERGREPALLSVYPHGALWHNEGEIPRKVPGAPSGRFPYLPRR